MVAMADLMDVYPSISDLERRARRRLPNFSWEYIASGTGDDHMVRRNAEALRDVTFRPQFLKGQQAPSIETELFGVGYSAPIGIAPIGLTALVWPGADQILATTAARHRIPYALSTVATEKPEAAGPMADGMGWFQLYPPREDALRRDLIDRAAASGFTTMVVTADVPWPSRRERQRKAQVRVPPVIGPRLVFEAAKSPAWTMALLRQGMPSFPTLEKYSETASLRTVADFIETNLGNSLSWEYLARVREQWDGPLVVKGILDPEDARRCVDSGADAIQVSNHGGRQLDATWAAIDALPVIVDAVGADVPILFDGGVRSGLDVAKALGLGADFVFCGRAFLFGLGALGERGPAHALEVLTDGLVNTMHQLGVETLDRIPARIAK